VIDVAAIKSRFEAVSPFLDERGRRLVAASEALGHVTSAFVQIFGRRQ